MMTSEKKVYALAYALRYSRIARLEGQRVPYQGQPLEAVYYFRWRDPRTEGIQGRGRRYLARIRANIPLEGDRSVEVFGPLGRSIRTDQAYAQPEKVGNRIEENGWFRITLAIFRGKIRLHEIDRKSTILPPPEKCPAERIDIAYALHKERITMPRLPQPPTIQDFFRARELVPELEKWDDGRKLIHELVRHLRRVQREIPRLLAMDLLNRVRERLSRGFKADA